MKDHSTRVYLDRSEVNDATAKMKQLGLKKLPDLFRLAVANLDVNLQEEVLLLKASIAELSDEYNKVLFQRDKMKSDSELHKHNAEYWENYAGKVMNDKDEFAKQLSKEIERYAILQGAYNVEVEKHNRLKDLACEYRDARDCFEKQLFDVEETLSELRKLRESDNQAAVELEQNHRNFVDIHEVFLKAFASKLGVPNTMDHITTGLVEFMTLFNARADAEEGRNRYFDMYTEAVRKMSVWRFLKYVFWDRKNKLIKKAIAEQMEETEGDN